MTPCMMVHMSTAPATITHLTDVDALILDAVRDQGSFDPAEVDVDRLRIMAFTEVEDGYVQRHPITRQMIVLALA